MKEALKRAIAAAGGPVALSKVLGISSAAISQWEVCPARRVLAVEAGSRGAVSRHELRPDLYPIDGDLRRPDASEMREAV